jgi:hypothetical protein
VLDLSFHKQNCQKMIYIVIQNVEATLFASILLGLEGTMVGTGDSGDPLRNLVGVVVGKRHGGKMMGSCWCC